jgi:hypothetical protein
MVRKLQVATSGIAAGSPSGSGSSISMNSLRNKPGPDPYGTYETQSCSGYTLNVYASNGNYGTYISQSSSNSPTCGYNPVSPGNSGVLTSSTSFTVPATSGGTIKILCYGAGGGGGGGTGRTHNTGPYTGGGGGGAGENTIRTISVAVGTTLTIVIQGAGSGGGARDGGYSGGSSGTAGGYVYVANGGTIIAAAGGGGGGSVSQLEPSSYYGYYTFIQTSAVTSGGYAGGSGLTGTSYGSSRIVNAEAGQSVSYQTTGGGYGGIGYTINTSINVTPYGFGSRGTGANGNDAGGLGGPSRIGPSPGSTGTVYGAGGGGGGKDNEYWGTTSYLNGYGGGPGAVFIYWGY